MTNETALRRVLEDILEQLEDVKTIEFADDGKFRCPYCWKPVPEAHSSCCKEAGHAVPTSVANNAIWTLSILRAKRLVRCGTMLKVAR